MIPETLGYGWKLLESAQPYYSSDLEYHNFDHVYDTLDSAQELIDRCENEGVEVEEDVVIASLVFHDAYYQKDAERFRFDSKEDLSKEVARKELRQMGYDDEFIKKVEGCIEATKHDVIPDENSTEEILVRAADLRGLMSNYDEFIENTEALREEYETLNGEKREEERWLGDVLTTLDHYGSQHLQLTQQGTDETGVSEFHKRLALNRQKFISEHVPEESEIDISII